MLTKNDITALRGLMHEVITGTVPGMIEDGIQKTVPVMIQDALEMNNHILKREIRDEVHALIKASEAGLIRRMDAIKDEILDGVSEIIGDRVLPQIDDLDRRVTHLEALPTH